jgi:hypothetical protein
VAEDQCRETLPVTGHGVHAAGREFTERRQPPHDVLHLPEVRTYRLVQLVSGSGQSELPGLRQVKIHQTAENFERVLFLSVGRQARGMQQAVGCLPHGRSHNHGLLIDAPLHDGGNTLHGPGVLDRGPAELTDDHVLFQEPLRLQELGIENRGAGGATYRVVSEDRKLEVEYGAGTDASD